jgi:hypothetical protein
MHMFAVCLAPELLWQPPARSTVAPWVLAVVTVYVGAVRFASHELHDDDMLEGPVLVVFWPIRKSLF